MLAQLKNKHTSINVVKPVNQILVDAEFGDCTRACLASILELDIDAVPNFIRFKGKWMRIFWPYINALGYQFYGTGWPKSEAKPNGHVVSECPNIDGFVIASVPSRSFEGGGHAVVMNINGLVVHDPNPNKAWEGVNVLDSGDLICWMMIGEKAREDAEEEF
jgi:hypothetical protein